MYIGTEETQKEKEFFNQPQMKEYSVICISGDFDMRLGYAINFLEINDSADPVFLSTARGDYRMFKTVEAAISLAKTKGVSDFHVHFDPR